MFGWYIKDRVKIESVHLVASMSLGVKPFAQEDKMAAIELWKAKVPLKTIREQMNMSERDIRNIFGI